MRLALIAALTVAVALSAAALDAAPASQAPAPPSIDGTWAFVMDSQMGQVSARVTFKAEGQKLTGTMKLDDGRTWPVQEGVVKGNEIGFFVTRERPSGGTMVYRMAGKLEGDVINGVATADMDGQTMELPWTMKRVK